MMLLLEVKNLSKSFGGIKAVRDVSIGIEQNSISSIIGPNGAGKTTFFNLLTGIYKPDIGRDQFQRALADRLRPDQVNAAGVARTFQSIRLFSNMTVLENVMVGMHSRLDVSLWKTLLRPPAFASRRSTSAKKRAICCISSGWRARATKSAATCPMAISGASKSRGRSPATPS